MSEWIKITQPGIRDFSLSPSFKKLFLRLIKEEVVWASENLISIRDIKNKVARDFLDIQSYCELDTLYQYFALSLLSETYKSLSLVKWDKFFKETDANPHYAVFHSDQLKYRTIVFAADYLSKVTNNPQLREDVILNPLSHITHTFFTSPEYLDIYNKSQLSLHYKILNYSTVEEKIINSEDTIVLSLNVKALLNTVFVRDGIQVYKELFMEMVRQKVIQPSDLVQYESLKMPMLEHYIALPNDNFYQIALELIAECHEEINPDNFLEYFAKQYNKIMELNDFPDVKENYTNIMKYFERKKLLNKLTLCLPVKENNNKSKGKI